MSEYIPGFDIVLKSTPYKVFMWLIKEANYEPTPYSIREPNPKLIPPSYRDINAPPADMKTGMAPYTKTLFIPSRDLSAPLPFDSNAYFAMEEFIFVYEHGEDASSNWFRNNVDVIRIEILSVEENLSQVVGDYLFRYKFELVDYMDIIRDELVKEFSVVEYKNGEPKESTKGKVRGPNSATIKAIEKLYEYRQDGLDGGFGDMPYWTHVCGEVGISPKTAKKYAPNLHENFRDKNYKWDWYMEDRWWEDSSS